MSGIEENILQRLESIKDLDPFNKQLLNDCYAVIEQLMKKNQLLERELDEFTGTKYYI